MKKVFFIIFCLILLFNVCIAVGQINDSLKTIIINNQVYQYYKKRFIPKGIIKVMSLLSGERIRFANPGKRYQSTDAKRGLFLKMRRLNFIGFYQNVTILCYDYGGFANHTHFVIIEEKNDRYIDKIHGFTTLAIIKNINDLRNCIESGNYKVTIDGDKKIDYGYYYFF